MKKTDSLFVSMSRCFYTALLLTAVLGCAKQTSESSVGGTEDSPEIPVGHFRAIIGLRDPAVPADSTMTPEQIEDLADSVASRHGLRVDRVLTLISAFAAVVDSAALGELRADANVRYVEPDRLLRPSRDTSIM